MSEQQKKTSKSLFGAQNVGTKFGPQKKLLFRIPTINVWVKQVGTPKSVAVNWMVHDDSTPQKKKK